MNNDWNWDSPELKKLIKTPLKERDFRLNEKSVKSNLDNLQGSDISESQFRGYEFEWEMWKFFHSLGPRFMNAPDEEFRFKLNEKSLQKRRQSDVIAVFENHVFIIECKHTDNPESTFSSLKRESKDFLSLSSSKNERIAEIMDDEINPVYIVCSSGFPSDDKEQIKALSNPDYPVIYFDEQRRGYINSVLEHSGSSEFALSQFLGFFRGDKPDFSKKLRDKKGKVRFSSRGDKKPKTEPWDVIAFHSKSGENKTQKVYTFSMSPENLLKISTVAHQQMNTVFEASKIDNKYYQRILTEKRLNSIKTHLHQKQSPFPNNVLVSYRGTENLKWKKISNDELDGADEGNVPGKLSFQACPGTFHVIDGQHRLFGYTTVNQKKGSLRESHRLIVTAFDNLKVEEEAEIFMEVNKNAKPIAASLLMEIEWSSEAVTNSNLSNGITFALRDRDDSCLNNLINQAEEAKTNVPLNPATIKANLRRLKIAKNYETWASEPTQHKGESSIFFGRNIEETVENYFNHLNLHLKEIQNCNQTTWKKSVKKNSDATGILSNNVVSGLINIIDRATLIAINEIKEKSLDDYELIRLNCHRSEILKTEGYISTRKKIFDKLNKLTSKYIVQLAYKISNEKDKKEVFEPDYFKAGGSAPRNATSFMIVEYLSEYPELIEPHDRNLHNKIKHNLTHRESLDIQKENTALRNKLKKTAKYNSARLNKDELSKQDVDAAKRAKDYWENIKRANQLMLYYSLGPQYWSGLICQHLRCSIDSPLRTGTAEKKYKDQDVWWYIQDWFEKERSEKGAHAYQNEFVYSERAQISLINNRRKIWNANTYNEKERQGVVDFLWRNLLIPPEGQPDLSDKELTPELLNNKAWTSYTRYIKVFEQYRAGASHSVDAQEPDKKPWLKYENEFNYYEPLFIKKLSQINEDLDRLKKVFDGKIDKEDEDDDG